MASGVRMLDTVRAFPTPEHIAFEYRLAGPLARIAAWSIDLLIRGAVFLALAIPLVLGGVRMGEGLALLIYFLLDWLSGGLCEALWGGQTPGKRAVGIQVVGVDGLPAGFGACMLRNILRWADSLPFLGTSLPVPTGVVGLITLFALGRFQRLGDLAAGTLVIYTERRLPPRHGARKEPAAQALLDRLPPELTMALDGRTARAIAAFVLRRRQFHPQRRSEIAEYLAGPLRRRFQLSPAIDADTLLVAAHLALFPTTESLAEQGSGGLAARTLARRRPDWLRLEGLLTGERGLPKGGEGVVELAQLYRSACTDLALSDAHHLPAPQVAYLHGLVAQAHLRFYRRARTTWRRLLRLVLVDIPGRMYGDHCLHIAGVTFFGLFVICGVAAYVDPGLAERFLGEAEISKLQENFSEPPRGRSTEGGVQMGGLYIFNNVGIALSCFASGIFLGIGSLVWLAYNGILLGLMFGYVIGTGGSLRDHFLEFVSAHGPFELGGIALAGAAGLRLGLGLVVRRGLPMADSLLRAASESAPVLAVAATCVALAAPIEAFVSPSDLALWAKRGLMWLCLLAMVLYIGVLGRLARRQVRAP